MSLLSQKPRHQRKKKRSANPRREIFNSKTGRQGTYKKERPADIRFAAIRRSKKNESKENALIPSLKTAGVIVFTVVLSLIALNWKDLNISTPEIGTFKPPVYSNTDEHIVNYAMKGMPNIFTPVVNQEEASENSDAEDTALEIENYHGAFLTFEWQQYTVQRNETVSDIAQKFNVSWSTILASNDIPNARKLQAGKILKIPSIDGIPHKVAAGQNLSTIAHLYKVPLEVILDVNDVKTDRINPGETIFIPGARMSDIDLRKSLGELFMHPLRRNEITSNYGWRKNPFTGAPQFHDGVDFRANIGTTVMASMDGVVEVVTQNRLYGKFIIIKHGNGFKTLYGHLNSFNVKEGDRVVRGRKIGESGNTGTSTGPHLHFGAYDREGRMVNPLELLK